jgi:hypothetical protein
MVAQAHFFEGGIGREDAGVARRIGLAAVVHRDLPIEADGRAADTSGLRAATQAAFTACRVLEVVAAVQHHVGLGHQPGPASAASARCTTACSTCTSGLMAAHGLARRFGLGLAHARQVVGDLPLQVGHVDRVVVDQGDAADPRGAQVQRHRRAQAASADHQRMAVQQALLAFDTDGIEQDVAGIAQQLVVVHLGGVAAERTKPAIGRASRRALGRVRATVRAWCRPLPCARPGTC